MAGRSPVKDAAAASSNTTTPTQFKPLPPLSVKPELPSTPTSRTPISDDADAIHVPSYSRWFSWDKIDSCEVRFLPEFFDARSPSRTPILYMYYRNSIVKQFRDNPSRKISFTDSRRTLVGDVASIRRVFDFLDNWGLINYSASPSPAPSKPSKDNIKSAEAPSLDSPSLPVLASKPSPSPSRRVCGACKSLCTIACFVCDKYDSTLCARCYVRGNIQVGLTNADYRRVEIADEVKAGWSEKETLLLLEAIMHYGDDWKKVAQHVGSKTDKDCVAHFVKLPFGEEFLGHPSSSEADSGFETNKRMRLTPLADASNPIMAQAAFLSALAGTDCAEAAAQAAVSTIFEVDDNRASKGGHASHARTTKREDVSSNGETNINALERECADVNSLLEKEEQDIERAIFAIAEVQMKEIKDKILHFEELDSQIEKEWEQLEGMKNLLFVDQLNLFFRRRHALKSEERMVENVKTDVS